MLAHATTVLRYPRNPSFCLLNSRCSADRRHIHSHAAPLSERRGPERCEVSGGALKGSERPEDHHAAVRRHPLQYHDAIFEFAFRFDGAKTVHLSINNKDGHVCRLIMTPKGMVLQTDKPAKLD